MQIDKIEVHIIREKIRELLTQPYYNKEIQDYLCILYEACDSLLGSYPHPSYPPSTYLSISRTLWNSIQYISGSSQNETPYEIVASMSSILKQWWKGDFAIITALLADKNYHFFESDPGKLLEFVLGVKPETELIQVALPSLYKHYPDRKSVV